MELEVIKLSKYNNFEELYNHYDKLSIGHTKDEVAKPSDMLSYYSEKNNKSMVVLR